MSVVFDICDAAKDRIDGGTYTAPYASITAESVPMVEVDLDETSSVVVSVVPRALGIEALTRGASKDEYTIGVVVQKMVDSSAGVVSKSEVSALVLLVEELKSRLQRVDLTITGAKARFVNIETDPATGLYDPGALYSQQQFRSVLNATYLTTS